MRDDMILTVGELADWFASERVPRDAAIRLNVGGHVGGATGHVVGWAPDESGDRVLVVTADEEVTDGTVR